MSKKTDTFLQAKCTDRKHTHPIKIVKTKARLLRVSHALPKKYMSKRNWQDENWMS